MVNFEFAIAIVASLGLIAGLFIASELAKEARLLTYMFLGFQTLMIVLLFGLLREECK